MSEIGTFLCPNFRQKKTRPKWGQKCSDFVHSTELGCFAIKRVIKIFLFIKRSSLFVPKFVSQFQTEKNVRKRDNFVPIPDVWNWDCLGMRQIFRAPKSERPDFGRLLQYLLFCVWSSGGGWGVSLSGLSIWHHVVKNSLPCHLYYSNPNLQTTYWICHSWNKRLTG